MIPPKTMKYLRINLTKICAISVHGKLQIIAKSNKVLKIDILWSRIKKLSILPWLV